MQLMSLHSAKGPEFPLVFLTGLEEGLFPHQRATAEDGRLEEERRLCYVGMTRARERLVLSHAESATAARPGALPQPVAVSGEIPSDLIQEIRAAGPAARTPAPESSTTGAMRLGCRVRHETFGEGVVLYCEGQGSHARVQVNLRVWAPNGWC